MMRHPSLYEMAGKMAGAMLGSGNGWIRRAPGLLHMVPLGAWLSQRDLPPPAEKSFHELWRRR